MAANVGHSIAGSTAIGCMLKRYNLGASMSRIFPLAQIDQ
jgi:hypothetical protein